MRILCKTNGGDPIELGSIWRENDPRISRKVRVVGYRKLDDSVQIETVGRPRKTFARRDRFGYDGRGKYSLSWPDTVTE